MIIKRAKQYGFCFGVRAALEQTQRLAAREKISVLGPLVHNPAVEEKLKALKVKQVEKVPSVELRAGDSYVITAHGVSDVQRAAWEKQGARLYDTTCPLVHRAHAQLRQLVREGFHPVIIGQASHVEVRGLAGDYPQATVLLDRGEMAELPSDVPLGIVAQTTQPIRKVRELVAEIRRARPGQLLRFVDTVCQPTKDRQAALEELCHEADLIIIAGGRNSNNTRQLLQTAREWGCEAYQVENAGDLREEWFRGKDLVGLTAGTSTLDETLDAVEAQIRQWSVGAELVEVDHE